MSNILFIELCVVVVLVVVTKAGREQSVIGSVGNGSCRVAHGPSLLLETINTSVLTLWALLAKDFVGLVLIGCFLASPIAWYFLHDWLQSYRYHIQISGWIFVVSGMGALSITLLTVSYQSIKAALMNPVKSLRSE